MDKKTYDHIPTKEEMLQIFNDDNDPTSWSYKRKYSKPDMTLYKVLVNMIIPFLIIAETIYFYLLKNEKYYTIPLIIYFIFRLKYIVIFIVELYQTFAPISIRQNCRFEPSCSEYMIQSIKKYNLIKGLYYGIRRINRCKVGNGGYDFP